MRTLPLFAPLKEWQTRNNAMHQELLSLTESTMPDLITYSNDTSIHDDSKGTLTRHLGLNKVSVPVKNAQGILTPGQSNPFSSVNLTHLPEHPNSKNEQFYETTEGKKPYAFKYYSGWEWRTDLNIDHTISFVKSLPLKTITLVRLIVLDPPAVGGVHIDASKTILDKYYSHGGVSLTFNIEPGNSELSYLHEGSVNRIPNELFAWHFNPSVPHAVGKVDQFRAQLRVFGFVEDNDYEAMLDLSKAVFPNH